MARGFLTVLFSMLVVAGCVSTKTYKARVEEVGRLQDQVAALEERARQQGVEISRLKDENESLSHRMESDKLELVREGNALRSELSEVSFRANELDDNLRAKEEALSVAIAELEILREEKRKAIEEKKAAITDLQKTYDELVGELNEEIDKGRVAVKQLKDKLSLSMVDKVLFDSGSSEVNKEGRKVLDRVAVILKKVKDRQIRIEGHTDNVKIGGKLRETFPSNWELSTARANNVLRYLEDRGGVDPLLLSAAGYSMYRPVASNDTFEGKARNRRIEIVLIPLDSDRIGEAEADKSKEQ